jgi:uncharacterized protein YdeI (YjbR/CyaY-like superfamily)
MKEDISPLRIFSRPEWRDWLQVNHATAKEVWLTIYKKHASKMGITMQEAMEEALCFGWVDSVMHGVDTEKFMLRFSPRRRGSVWAMSNIKRVEKLIAEGRMTPSGMATVEEARQNGAWDAAIRRENINDIPNDLQEALETNEIARRNFERLPNSLKKQSLWWIAEAKTPATRQRRINQTVKQAAENAKASEK